MIIEIAQGLTDDLELSPYVGYFMVKDRSGEVATGQLYSIFQKEPFPSNCCPNQPSSAWF